MYLRFMRDERANIGDIFQGFKKGYLNIVLANLLRGRDLSASASCSSIVPGIIFACRLAFVRYLVMDKGLDPVAAIEKSWFMTRGHGWRIFGMYLLSILLVCIGFLLLIVGGGVRVHVDGLLRSPPSITQSTSSIRPSSIATARPSFAAGRSVMPPMAGRLAPSPSSDGTRHNGAWTSVSTDTAHPIPPAPSNGGSTRAR